MPHCILPLPLSHPDLVAVANLVQVIGATPMRPMFQPIRPTEISAWIEQHTASGGPALASWVAIDDRNLVNEHGGGAMVGHFVHTHPNTGLTKRLGDEAIAILSMGDGDAASTPPAPTSPEVLSPPRARAARGLGAKPEDGPAARTPAPVPTSFATSAAAVLSSTAPAAAAGRSPTSSSRAAAGGGGGSFGRAVAGGSGGRTATERARGALPRADALTKTHTPASRTKPPSASVSVGEVGTPLAKGGGPPARLANPSTSVRSRRAPPLAGA